MIDSILKKVIFLMIVLAGCGVIYANAENPTDEEQINSVLKRFISSVQNRDVDAIRTTFDKTITLIEDSDTESMVIIADANSIKEVFPPADNDDWDGVVISDISVTISPSQPSTAMVSSIIKLSLREEDLARLQEIPSEVFNALNDAQRENIEKMIKEKSINASIFAIVAKIQGNWKIVSMTFPK